MSIELFIALEIKKKRKYVNLKDILMAFKALGSPIDDDWLNEIKKLYEIRGNTIAHSFGKEENVTFEEVGKCKIFADYLIYSHLNKKSKSIIEVMDKKVKKPSLKPSMEPKSKNKK